MAASCTNHVGTGVTAFAPANAANTLATPRAEACMLVEGTSAQRHRGRFTVPIPEKPGGLK
ncbi:MAG: hypothetical protein M5U19_21390 [Microthrixaceae bacterium]|nr:hypothetical protein [Microthrixaceae bacterium]